MGTAPYRSVKQHNFEMVKFLVSPSADCNAVHLDFNFNQQQSSDGMRRVGFFNTPIDLLCKENETENNHDILQYLLQKRTIVNEEMIDQRIEYCKRLSTIKDQDTLFDYVTSYFLRQNMYEHIDPLEARTIYTLLAAALNFDAKIHDEPLNDRGSHEIFLTIMIRSLFEELVHFNLGHSCSISKPEQYKCVLDELLHHLETHNFLKDLYQIPYDSRESINPSIVENIITKLKDMKNKEEYTLPMKWYDNAGNGHAVCLNFVYESDSIIIRIDNLYRKDGREMKHKIRKVKKQNVQKQNKMSRVRYKVLAIIPKIIGSIPVSELDNNKDYFKCLLTSIQAKDLSRDKGIEILYKNKQLKNLNTDQVSQMTDRLEEQSKSWNCFIPQAEANCFIKCHEPGLAIRSNDPKIFEIIKTIVQTYTVKLASNSNGIKQKKEKLENELLNFWKNESNIKFNAEYAAKLHRYVVVWLDKHIGVPGDNELMKQRFRRVAYPLYTFTDIQLATDFIKEQEVNKTSVFFITSGSLGAEAVKNIFNNSCVLRIYVYCYDIPGHTVWCLPYLSKLKLFDFDAELLTCLTLDIARHLTTMATDMEKKNEPVRAAGLLDWAAWLYHDALLNEQIYYRQILDDNRRKRQKLNETYRMTFLNQFNP